MKIKTTCSKCGHNGEIEFIVRIPKEKKKKEVEIEVEFSYQKYLEKMDNDKDRRMQIISYFFQFKNLKFDNKQQIQTAIKRYLRASKDLIGFKAEQIKQAMAKAQKEYPEIWTLETITKLLTK